MYNTREDFFLQVNKSGNGIVLRDGVGAREVGEVEAVALPGHLEHLHLPVPPAGPEPLGVRAAAVADHILLGEADEHAPAREPPQRRRAGSQRVDPGVVLHARGARVHRAPHGDHALGHPRVGLLRRHRAGAQEVRVDEDGAGDPGAVRERRLLGAGGGGGGAHRHVVRDVGAGALAADAEAGEVAVVGEPGLLARSGGGGGVGGHPAQRLPGVVVGGGERVLGREAVLDGDDDGAGPRGERGEVPVEDEVEGGVEAEAAAVEVDEDRELVAGYNAVDSGLFGCRREVEADGDLGGDGKVLGGDARGGVRGGRDGVGAEVALHAAALVDADELRHLEDDLVVARAGASHGWVGTCGPRMKARRKRLGRRRLHVTVHV
ncbi:unnamed protein product [Urochloa decumbens]|uniref:Uncharacterized protein n=1 Tax=Urochloa decumbens TaxID=240449 RepID=A0ABC9G6E8_9POAL